MKIRAIDSRKNLFQVKDALSNETMDKLSEVELEDLPWKEMNYKSPFEGSEARRQITDFASGSIFEQITVEINTHKETISKAIGRNIKNIYIVFWLDMPGFHFPLHIDNPSVDIAFQLYLKDCDGAGTIFYTPKDSEIEIKNDWQHWHFVGKSKDAPLRHAFNCVKNTGYIMLNDYNQLHGVPITLGNDDLRLSAYCFCME